MRRYVFPLLLGVAGCAILVALGLWQLERLAWKEDLLAAREARLLSPPSDIPEAPDSARDQYLAVGATGRIVGEPFIRILASERGEGQGYRIVAAFETDGRRLLLDRGFVAEGGAVETPAAPVAVTGNLLWPDDTTASTPPPDLGRNIWFSRDVAAMAEALGTEPVLIVLRDGPPAGDLRPVPLDNSAIPNDHLEYAITWFSLCFVWAGMTGYLLWRIRRRTV